MTAVRATVRIHCSDAATAERLRRSLAVDDPTLAALAVKGSDLTMAASAGSALGLLRTLDDLLACLRAAEPGL